ncbi:hypothetical protein LGV61_01360 [Desulfurispirillum indicum]|uniref:hypothetical protein n=1 Tax=Desulfurispirillum indicum TaxID=936456 RepID=UPI001CFB7728|nr:hypothetical protein [Desulfurispirillum indicum]UCZ56950.1 hypothetical protein LGV61_01360 [Desulfurispirillum indicum]
MNSYFLYRGYSVMSAISESAAKLLIDGVLDNKARNRKIFRDNRRTFIARADVGDFHDVVLKVPRARNKRLWERFLTLFRSSEAFRHHRSICLFSSLGFQGPRPLLAVEKRSMGVVTHSFFLYGFVRGRVPGASDGGKVGRELHRLHRLGYMRRDPQAANFLIAGERVYFIDFKLTRPLLFNSVRTTMEFAQFLHSMPTGASGLKRSERKHWRLRVAWHLHFALSRIRKIRRATKKWFSAFVALFSRTPLATLADDIPSLICLL